MKVAPGTLDREFNVRQMTSQDKPGTATHNLRQPGVEREGNKRFRPPQESIYESIAPLQVKRGNGIKCSNYQLAKLRW